MDKTIKAGNYAWVSSENYTLDVSLVTNDVLCDNQYDSSIIIKPIEITEDWLLNLGFKKNKSLILDSYSISIAHSVLEYKELSVNIEKGNQYIHVRSGDVNKPRHEDEVITIFNGDFQGELFVHIIQNIYFYLTFKELVKKNI